MALVSLILGICSTLSMGFMFARGFGIADYVPFIGDFTTPITMSFLAVVLGIIGLILGLTARKRTGVNRNTVITGIVLNSAGILGALSYFALILTYWTTV